MSNPQTKKADGGDQPKKMPEKPSLKSSNATGPATASKARWGKAITGVRTVGTFKRRFSSVVQQADPFLERFTVTGRAILEEHQHAIWFCEDIFTLKFWKEMVVDPSGNTYYYWSAIVMLCVLYNLLILIVRAVFQTPNQGWVKQMWYPLDYLSDFVYLCDMFAKSRIGFLEQGLLVRDVKRLTKKYVKSWFFYCDILSILPLDFFYFLAGENSLFRINRLFKTWRLVQFFHMAETHTNFPNLVRVANLILYIIIIIHWNGCFYFAISSAIGFGSDSWVYPDPTLPGNDDFWKQYLTSFYWSCLTLTTIGDTEYPVQPVEFLVCICDSLVGVLIFATIFGNVGAMINHMDAERETFQQKVDAVKRFMELRGITADLQSRVVKWFDYTWNNKQSVDDKSALEYLPEKLRAEISIHVHMHTLRRVSIFQDCEPGLLVELVLKLRLQVYSPGDYICRKGDIGKEMYIIKRGRLQVVSEDGKKVFVTLSDGAVFGEVSILNIAGNKTGNRRTAGVRSVGYSDLFCLSKNDLWEAIEEYPEAKKMLSEKGKQILRKDNLLDEETARKEERRQQAMISKVEMIVDAVEDMQKELKRISDKLEQGPSQLYVDSAGIPTASSSRASPDNAQKLSASGSLSRVPKTPSPIPEEDEEKAKD